MAHIAKLGHMNPVSNPYSPGAGTPPPALVGRDTELREFRISLQRMSLGRSARSSMLTGLRGVGKTVLLNEFGEIAQGHNWIHHHIEATEDLKFPDAVSALARKAILQISLVQRLEERAKRALGILKSFQWRWEVPEVGNVGFTVDAVAGVADSGALDDDLADLFVEVGSLAREQGTGILFTIDELQYMSREDLSALIVGLHRISQKVMPLMIVGAGLPSLPGLAGEAKSYAERLFEYRVIGRLSEDDAHEALQSPARKEGVEWASEALREVASESEGYPYFLQEFGKQSWNAARSPSVITLEDAHAAFPVAKSELDSGFFAARFDRTTRAERDYLLAMASFGTGPYQSGDVARSMGRRTTQVGPVRDSLIKRGLCYSPSHNVIDFTVPMFDQFVRRRLG